MTDLRPSSNDGVAEAEEGKVSLLRNLSNKASLVHGRVPYLSKLPFAAVAIIATLITINLLVWAAVGAVLVCSLSREKKRDGHSLILPSTTIHP